MYEAQIHCPCHRRSKGPLPPCFSLSFDEAECDLFLPPGSSLLSNEDITLVGNGPSDADDDDVTNGVVNTFNGK